MLLLKTTKKNFGELCLGAALFLFTEIFVADFLKIVYNII
jgi:hypothetical protein